MKRLLNHHEHKIITDNAKAAWTRWYTTGVKGDMMLPQDTLEFWMIVETEKYLQSIRQDHQGLDDLGDNLKFRCNDSETGA
jgi:hypothetical protein